MKSFTARLAFALLIFAHQLICFSSGLCKELFEKHYSNISELKSQITKNMFELKNDDACLELLLTKGQKDVAEVFMDELAKRGINYRDQLKSATNNIQRKLKDIYNTFRFDDSDYISASPAFQWAQNVDKVFIEIKYAHRFDSPGCLEVSKEDINLEGSSLEFQAFCVQGDVPIKFNLALQLFGKIDKSQSVFSSTSVGRYQLTLKKEEAAYWKNLQAQGVDSPPNMRMWLEMREKYLEEIQKYIDEKDEEENKDIDNEIESMKKKKSKAPEGTEDL